MLRENKLRHRSPADSGKFSLIHLFKLRLSKPTFSSRNPVEANGRVCAAVPGIGSPGILLRWHIRAARPAKRVAFLHRLAAFPDVIRCAVGNIARQAAVGVIASHRVRRRHGGRWGFAISPESVFPATALCLCVFLVKMFVQRDQNICSAGNWFRRMLSVIGCRVQVAYRPIIAFFPVAIFPQ